METIAKRFHTLTMFAADKQGEVSESLSDWGDSDVIVTFASLRSSQNNAKPTSNRESWSRGGGRDSCARAVGSY
ncbi:hypothetical protein J6590_067217 [Homalodisca vitripennis]|nr:hypothetical protein J6590_067217 [Homalodisca vitripennis]